MALNIGNKIFRNIQEQVAYNSKCIKEINDYLDGLEYSDSLIVLTSSSGSLTAEEMAVAEKKVAFIYLNGDLFVKSEDDIPSSYIFRQVKLKANEVGSAYYEIGGSKIVVTIGTATYAQSDEVVITVYSKSQIDSIVDNIMTIKANVADVYSKTQADLLLSGKADLSGANFTGPITAPSIIENMSGYSVQNVNSIVDELIYASACKNGNKVTFVIFGSITPLAQTNYNILQFSIPSAVGEKLYPFTSGTITNLLDVKNANCFIDSTAITTAIMRVRKTSDQVLTFELRAQSLTPNTQYHLRFEVTFLLSDNLAS